MKQKNYLFILSSGKVAAINKKDGSIAWEVKLKEYIGTSVKYSIGQIQAEGDKLFIGVSGILLCLSSKDGSLTWKNELKGWGYQFISMANTNNEAAASAIESAAADTAVIAAT